MRETSTAARALSIVTGLGIAATGGWLAISHAPTADAKALVVAMTAGAAIGAFMLPRLAGAGFCLALVGIVAAEGYGFAASVERLLAIRETRALDARQDAEPRRVASDRVAEAKAAVARAEASETAETGKGGCGPVCRGLQAKADAARARLASAETALAGLPVARSESPLADALGWSPLAVSISMAAAAQTGLLALMLAFMGHGHGHGRKPPPRREAAGRAKKVKTRAARKPRPAKAPSYGANVVAFRRLLAANAN